MYYIYYVLYIAEKIAKFCLSRAAISGPPIFRIFRMVGIFSPKIAEICARCSSTRKKHFAAIASKIGRHGRDIRPKIEIGPSGPPIFSNFPDFLNFIADNCRKFPPDVPRHESGILPQSRAKSAVTDAKSVRKSSKIDGFWADFGRILDGTPSPHHFQYICTFIHRYIYIYNVIYTHSFQSE